MRALALTRFGLDGLALVERNDPAPGPGEVAIRIEAVSLNRRDLLLVEGTYNPRQKLPVVPCSDGAGTVVAAGAGVSSFKAGDRVVPAFFPGWRDGRPTMPMLMTSRGGPGGDGLVQDIVIYPADGVVPVPSHLTTAEAACLPCAGLTAYSALFGHSDGNLAPGGTLLVQGTGGVSVFAVQFAKAIGAKVVATTSSPEKAERLAALGADHVINYRAQPKWWEAARAFLPDGADIVVEVGGAETMEGALRVIRPGGIVSLIGVLSGPIAPVNLPLVVMRQVRLQGVTVGPVAMFADMMAFMERSDLKPVIGARFGLADHRQAFEAMAGNTVFGKIVVEL